MEAGSPVLARLHEQARLAAQTRLPIALLGEAGSGKEWLARAIHVRSERRQRPFACLDAVRLPTELLGETLFGPRTQKLGLGTVYLRDLDALPREWQARLAETLQVGENADFPRIIVGLCRDTGAAIQAGRLLAELYCAVSPVTITLPPLRERLAQLPRFIDIFLQRARDLQPHGIQAVSPETLNLLRAYAWPGNLSELQEVLREACRRAKGERLEPADLPFHLKQARLPPPERHLPLDALLEQVERRLIELALRLAQNNQTRAAELLEIWRPRLMRRMEKFGLKDPE